MSPLARTLLVAALAACAVPLAIPTAAQPAAAQPETAQPATDPSVAADTSQAPPRPAAAPAGPRGPFPPLAQTLAGVVWSVPDSTESAVMDLRRMHEAGVRMARTGLVRDPAILQEASRLGIALWQDLPVKGLAAAFLVRRADAIADTLAAALAMARPYSSARHFGLARASDTSDPRARAYMESLTQLVRQRGAPGTQTYYVSRFPESDRAAESVDVVLLDARESDPVQLLGRWRAQRDTPVGLASVGVGVRPGRSGGWRASGTEAAQARALETAFMDLLAMSEPPAAAFAYRWRDADADLIERDQRTEVAGTRFGLLGEGDEPREAYAVASGFWTGRQRVFAFDAGDGERRERLASPLLLIGWGLVIGLGVLYAGAPRLSGLAPRYFTRRDLYRDAVRRGFDLSAAETTGLALALSLAAGVVATAALRALARTDALVAATASWSVEAQARLTGLLGRPLVLVAVLAAAYLTWVLLNLIWLAVISGRRRLRPAQALSLAVWCRWAWLPLMVVALVLGSIDAGLATVLAPAVLGVGLFVETVAGYRMMSDVQAVTYAPPARALLVGFGVPLLLGLAALVALSVTSQDEIGFLWHLATRR
ncbi:MAG: hypothetical protein AAGK21_04725 [Bacteroidota bacterium]